MAEGPDDRARLAREIYDEILRAMGSDNATPEVSAALGLLAQATPRELAKAAAAARRVAMLAELARLEGLGLGRMAPMRVAFKFAADRRDPVEVASLARSLRRWRASASL